MSRVARILIEKDVPIPLRDGTLTVGDLYRPADGNPGTRAGDAQSLQQGSRTARGGDAAVAWQARGARLRRRQHGRARALRLGGDVHPLPGRGTGRLRHHRVDRRTAVVRRQRGGLRSLLSRRHHAAHGARTASVLALRDSAGHGGRLLPRLGVPGGRVQAELRTRLGPGHRHGRRATPGRRDPRTPRGSGGGPRHPQLRPSARLRTGALAAGSRALVVRVARARSPRRVLAGARSGARLRGLRHSDACT